MWPEIRGCQNTEDTRFGLIAIPPSDWEKNWKLVVHSIPHPSDLECEIHRINMANSSVFNTAEQYQTALRIWILIFQPKNCTECTMQFVYYRCPRHFHRNPVLATISWFPFKHCLFALLLCPATRGQMTEPGNWMSGFTEKSWKPLKRSLWGCAGNTYPAPLPTLLSENWPAPSPEAQPSLSFSKLIGLEMVTRYSVGHICLPRSGVKILSLKWIAGRWAARVLLFGEWNLR